ncbi:MAG: hypothetical protein AAB583_06975, partial [Patescibacteria group bacterium]
VGEGGIVAESINATSTTATSTIQGFLDVLGTGANSTSTYSSNLWVKGTLQAGTGSVFLNDSGLVSSDGNINLSRSATSTLGTNGLTIGTNQFVVQQSSGRVGVGTTSPSARISLTGGGTGTGRTFVIADSNNAEILTVLDNGNVGIGTTNPTAKLHIGGTPGSDGIRFPDGTLMTSASVGSAGAVSNAGNAVIDADSDANGIGEVLLRTGGTSRLIVSNGGNLGIGTTSPGTPLSVTGSAVITGTTTAVNFNATNTTGYYIGGTQVLSSTALGSGVTASSLTSVGTLTSGTWQGTAVAVGFGGTGLTGTPTFGQVLRGTGTGYTLVATSTLGIALSDTTGTLAVSRGGTALTTFGGTNTILFTTAADTLSSITTANNGVLVTSVGGVPSISSTIPSATQDNITRTGVLASGSIASGFGAIDIGTDGITAGQASLTGAGTGLSVTNNATIGGTLGVTGLTSLSQASSTRESFFDRIYIGGTATTTISQTAVNLPTGGTYQINGTDVLSSTALGSGVTASSLTS